MSWPDVLGSGWMPKLAVPSRVFWDVFWNLAMVLPFSESVSSRCSAKAAKHTDMGL